MWTVCENIFGFFSVNQLQYDLNTQMKIIRISWGVNKSKIADCFYCWKKKTMEMRVTQFGLNSQCWLAFDWSKWGNIFMPQLS